MIALTCGICVTLLFFCSIISRLELIFRQQPSLLQQTSLFPLLPFFQNDLRIRRKQTNEAQIHSYEMQCVCIRVD